MKNIYKNPYENLNYMNKEQVCEAFRTLANDFPISARRAIAKAGWEVFPMKDNYPFVVYSDLEVEVYSPRLGGDIPLVCEVVVNRSRPSGICLDWGLHIRINHGDHELWFYDMAQFVEDLRESHLGSPEQPIDTFKFEEDLGREIANQ